MGICPTCGNEFRVPVPAPGAAGRGHGLGPALLALVLCLMPWLCLTVLRMIRVEISLRQFGVLVGVVAVLCAAGLVCGHRTWRRTVGQRAARVVSMVSLVIGYFSVLTTVLVLGAALTGSIFLYKQYEEPPDFQASDMPDFEASEPAPQAGAPAGLVVEFKIEPPDLLMPKTKAITKSRDGKSRADSRTGSLPLLMSIVTDENKEEMVTLDHAAKTFSRQSLAGRTKKAPAAVPSEKPKDLPSQKERVGPWDAEVFTVTTNGKQKRVWVVQNFPGAAAIKSELAKLKETVDALDVGKFYFGGMVVKLETPVKSGKITFTLLKAVLEPVDDGEFKIPEGYREMRP